MLVSTLHTEMLFSKGRGISDLSWPWPGSPPWPQGPVLLRNESLWHLPMLLALPKEDQAPSYYCKHCSRPGGAGWPRARGLAPPRALLLARTKETKERKEPPTTQPSFAPWLMDTLAHGGEALAWQCLMRARLCARDVSRDFFAS